MRINIAKHIFDFLIQNKKVSIRDIGTFSLNHIPANFGEGRKSLLPPSKEIAFSNEYIKEFQVSKYLAKQEQIPEKKAKQFLQIFNDKIITALENNDKAEIGYLGTLIKYELGLEFQQSHEATKAFAMGLPEVTLPDMTMSKESESLAVGDVSSDLQTEGKTETLHEKLSQDVNQMGEPTSVSKASEVDVLEVPEKSKRSIGFFLFPIVGILLIGALFSFLQKHLQSDKAIFKSNSKAVTLGSDSIQREDAKVLDSAMQDGGASSEDKGINNKGNSSKSSIEASTIGENQCIIIIGAFTERKRTEKLIADIKSAGYKLYDKEYGPYYRIGIQFECDRNNQEKLRSILKQTRRKFNASSWYLIPEMYVE